MKRDGTAFGWGTDGKCVIDKAHTIVLRNSPSITNSKTLVTKHTRLCFTTWMWTNGKCVIDKTHAIVLRKFCQLPQVALLKGLSKRPMVDCCWLSTPQIPPLLFKTLRWLLQSEEANVAGQLSQFLPVLRCLKAVEPLSRRYPL